jgi:hypothetical protein
VNEFSENCTLLLHSSNIADLPTWRVVSKRLVTSSVLSKLLSGETFS